MKLSVIIPTLNEALYLTKTLAAVREHATDGRVHEIIVADCGSADSTAELAVRSGARLVQGPRPFQNRATAMNAGAARATGDVLLFLDADTLCPSGYDRLIRSTLNDTAVVGGVFEFALDGRAFGLRVVELINRVRYRVWPRYFGDQGIFVRAEVFERVRGYPEVGIMESPRFCSAMDRLGRLALIRKPMTTSARRFVQNGVYRVLAHDARIWWLDLLGRSTEEFANAYRQNNVQRGQSQSVQPARNSA